MKRGVASLLAAVAGYVSMSQEILWFRALSYATGGAPSAFAVLLGCFLLGIAFGALYSKRLLASTRLQAGEVVSGLFLLGGVLGFLALPMTANAFATLQESGLYYAYALVAVGAFPSGALFPILCHVAIDPRSGVGASLSRLYVFNIVGSTLGPLFTTFVLMDRWSLGRIAWLIAAISGVASALSVVVYPARRGAWGLAAAGLLLLAAPTSLYDGMLERLHYKTELTPELAYRKVIQTRSGIIAVAPSPGAPDVLYGGGVYDGAFNVDPRSKANGIFRAFMLFGLHRAPERVLEIGLASGSWTRVLADHPRVKALTVIEINPGYLELVRQYPQVASILDDPKIQVHIDDGRRWLARHPDERFDAIVMNTSFHWRSQATNVLSQEFLRLAKAHLREGGLVYLNTTGSQSVRCTVASVFTHVASVGNFVAGSDAPFDLSPAERGQALAAQLGEGRPELAHVRQELLDFAVVDEGETLRAEHSCWRITDDNMASEYKEHWRGVYPSRSWAKLFERLASAPP